METETKRKPNALYGQIAGTLILVLGLMFIGAKIQQARTPERLPANNACISYVEAHTKQLHADLNQHFGVEKPQETPSKEDVAKLEKDCVDTQTKYEVVIK